MECSYISTSTDAKWYQDPTGFIVNLQQRIQELLRDFQGSKVCFSSSKTVGTKHTIEENSRICNRTGGGDIETKL